jgi:hypothetical protein
VKACGRGGGFLLDRENVFRELLGGKSAAGLPKDGDGFQDGGGKRWNRYRRWSCGLGLGRGWRGRGFEARLWEGDFADLREQGAEVASGDDVGEVVVGFGAGECVEDFVDVERDLGGIDPAEVAPERAPSGEVGIDVAFGDRGRAVGGGFRCVMTAKGLVTVGGGAAFSAVAPDEGTFGSHGTSLRQVTGDGLQATEKPRVREAPGCSGWSKILFCPIYSEYQTAI